RAVIAHLTLRPERTRLAASSLLLATDVADYLAARGMPFRQAHEVVGAMLRHLLVQGRDFESLSIAEWRAFSDRFDDDVRAEIPPRACVAARARQQPHRH